ncbi:ATP-dependent Clp protease ATP-binding subunit [Aggregatilineales bacterium SYSU G02658]
MPNKMERFTQRARRVLSLAQEEAERLQHGQISTEHLLLGLMREEGGVAGRVLRELGLDQRRVEELVVRLTDSGSRAPGGTLDLSAGTKKVLELAVDEARRMGHHYIGTEHLLLGLVRQQDGVAIDVLRRLGISPEEVRRQTRRVLSESPVQQSPAPTAEREQRRSAKENKTPLVDQLATDLTALASEGKLDPVVGRETEIERVIQVLSRRRKNNPALIGEPGVGKTAIVEGLAQRIIDGDTPKPLLHKRVLQLDVGSLVAGTMYRGQFEERLKRVIEELKASDTILFIDEVHMLIGAGSAGSSVDAANILKPALSRGELQCIGATTLDEYRKHIESDAALARRFQQILVDEPTIEETIEILQGIKIPYQEHHNVEITDESIEAAANLSARYIPDRFLPDKAIDLIDEASARLRMYKSPEAAQVRRINEELEHLSGELERAEDDGLPADEIEELRRRIDSLNASLADFRANWNEETGQPRLTADDIAEVVTMWTGIPVTRLGGDETQRLMEMEEHLHKRIVGQHEAIVQISKAVRRARAGLKDPRRPIGSFMFLGPTGVGKTELTKALAQFMFGSEEALVRLDMSEFMERHSVARLVGAPPGYVGYEDAGQLTEAVRRRPYSIVVFDEIEKAHPETFNMLLQIMEEGTLTDARGRRVDFRNTIVVMTSNVGADQIKRQASLGFRGLPTDEQREAQSSYEEMTKNVMDQVRKMFRPEFLNRVDATIIFRSLTKDEIKQIVNLELDKVRERLIEHAITLEVTPEAMDWLADKGYDAEYGARPLRRLIQNEVEDALSDGILSGKFQLASEIRVTVENNELKLENVEEPTTEM